MNTPLFYKAVSFLALFALTVAATSPVVLAQDDESHTERYRFEFEIDADSLLEDLAVHFDPPDLSALEELRFRFDEPFTFFSIEDPTVRAEEQRRLSELERESRELARRAREAEGTDRERLEADLRRKLDEVFDAKLELRRQRIERLEERLRTEREHLRAREEARADMIDRRLRTLMGEEDLLEW